MSYQSFLVRFLADFLVATTQHFHVCIASNLLPSSECKLNEISSPFVKITPLLPPLTQFLVPYYQLESAQFLQTILNLEHMKSGHQTLTAFTMKRPLTDFTQHLHFSLMLSQTIHMMLNIKAQHSLDFPLSIPHLTIKSSH
jgi:hypothetical protein